MLVGSQRLGDLWVHDANGVRYAWHSAGGLALGVLGHPQRLHVKEVHAESALYDPADLTLAAALGGDEQYEHCQCDLT